MIAENYHHSGRIGPLGIPLMLIGGTITAVVLGMIYAYGLAWIPLIYAAFLLTAGLGAGIGFAVGICGKWGKVRSPMMIGFFGLLAGVIGLTAGWSFDMMAKFPEVINGPLLTPTALQAWIEYSYTEGTWGIGRAGNAVTGNFLAAIWVIEAVVILGLSFYVAYIITASTPFCEQCMAWTTTVKGYARLFPPEDDDSALDQLCGGDVNTISQFTKAPHSAGAYLRLDVTECPDCDQCNCMSVALAEVTQDKNGDNQINTSVLTEHLMLETEAFRSLKEQVDLLQIADNIDTADDIEDDTAEDQLE